MVSLRLIGLLPGALLSAACGAPAGGGYGTPAVTVADLAFRPPRDGFGFRNYRNQPPVENLTPREIHRLFGDAACAAVSAGECRLTPAAALWMEHQNRSMAYGHCEGMVVLSLSLFTGRSSRAPFGGGAATYDLRRSGPLEREIAYWFATQATEPTRGGERGLTPGEAIDLLVAGFRASPAEVYTMGVYERGAASGHAVTPYAVRDRGGGRFAIAVYDSNLPGVEEAVEIDRGAGTWSYRPAVAAEDGGKPRAYGGDSATRNLTLTPLALRFAPQACPFCGTAQGRELLLPPAMDALVIDEHGRRLGTLGGERFDEIPGARASGGRGGAPVYRLPAGGALTIVLDPHPGQGTPGDVLLVGPGQALRVAGGRLAPGRRAALHVAADGRADLTAP
jgi:hypothetical protein